MSGATEFIKEQKEFNHKVDQRLHKVDQRLSVLEKDVKQIKLLPTIKKELKTQNKLRYSFLKSTIFDMKKQYSIINKN